MELERAGEIFGMPVFIDPAMPYGTVKLVGKNTVHINNLGTRPTADLGEELTAKLRAWPAAERDKDALSAAFVAALMEQAADRIDQLREALAELLASCSSNPVSGGDGETRYVTGLSVEAVRDARDVLSRSA